MEDTSIGVESTDTLVSADTPDNTGAENIGTSADTTEAISGENDIAAQATEEVEADSDASALAEEDLESIQQEIEDALKNEDTAQKAPKWFRETIRRYGKHVEALNTKVAPFEHLHGYLEPAQIDAHVDMIRSLNDYRIGQRGVPEPQVEQFVEKFAEIYPHLLGEIVLALGTRPVDDSGLNYFQAAMKQVGLDPSRIEEYKAYLENGPQSGGTASDVDVSGIDARYRDVFKALEPSLQEEISLMSTENQNALLARYNEGFQAQKAQEQAKQAETEKFYADIDRTAFEKFNGATDSALKAFEQTLAKATFSPDEQMNSFIVQQNLQTVLTAINPNAWGHDSAKAALGRIGITVDDTRISAILNTLEQESRNTAYFARTGNTAQEKTSALKLARAQQELIAQGQKVAAQIMKTRGQALQTNVDSQNALLAQAQARPAITGQPVDHGNPADWLKNLPPPGTEERRIAIAQLGMTGNG